MAVPSLEAIALTNVTYWDRLLGRRTRLRYRLRHAFPRGAASLADYRRTCRNPTTVVAWLLVDAAAGLIGWSVPIRSQLRDGGARRTRGPPPEVWAREIFPHPAEPGVTCARFRGRTLEFEGDPHDGDLISVFLLQEYARLPVEGRAVLDVGASIGDSAAYFAARGAAKVVAVEPWPRTYAHLARNVVRNGFGATIVTVHSGVGHPGEVRIDTEQRGSAAHQVSSVTEGTTVPIRTLEQLTDEFGITDGVLKMDCEGSEYAAILEASPAVLRRFSHLMMEYHYGYRNLRRQLEAAGFHVQVERPATRFEPAFTPSQVGVGNLYAERR